MTKFKVGDKVVANGVGMFKKGYKAIVSETGRNWFKIVGGADSFGYACWELAEEKDSYTNL